MRYHCLGALLIAVALAACLPAPKPIVTPTAALPITSTVDLSYDPAPGMVILYGDVQPLAGAPPIGMKCLYETVPTLRIWGDGLVFLDVSAYGASGPPLWTGHLSPAQVQDVLAYLADQGFMDDWTPSVPSAAGTGIGLGVHLKSGSKDQGSGDLKWPFYEALVRRLLPMLTPLNLQPDTDTRISSLNIGSRECTTPTVLVPPDYTATLSVLESLQPPSKLEHFVGICECVPSNAVPFGLVVQNSWQRQIGSEWVLAEAGVLQMEPDAGVIGVRYGPTDWWISYSPGPGSLRISAEQGNRLTLQSTQGATYYFDVPGRQFVPSLSAVIPTTPVPTGYPMLHTPSPPPPQSTTYP